MLSSRQVVFYVDNDGVRDVLISCNTADPVGSLLLTSVLEREGAFAISSWFTRVPSKSNIADNPSRGDINDLIAIEAKHEQVEPVNILKALGPVAKVGEMSGPASPIEKGAISCYLAEWFGCET